MKFGKIVLAVVTLLLATHIAQAQSTYPPVAKPILASDIKMRVSAYDTFASNKWNWSAECNGQAMGAFNIPETGIHGFELGSGYGTRRFGKVMDPADSTRKVLMFRADVDDNYSSGAPRCELTFSPSFSGKIPVGEDFWFAFGMRLQDWNINTTDEQIVMQWHWSNGSIPLGPFFTFLIKGPYNEFDIRSYIMKR
jgi:hypothetical protein